MSISSFSYHCCTLHKNDGCLNWRDDEINMRSSSLNQSGGVHWEEHERSAVEEMKREEREAVYMLQMRQICQSINTPQPSKNQQSGTINKVNMIQEALWQGVKRETSY